MDMINFADAVYVACGSMLSGKKGKGQYERWRKRLERRANKLMDVRYEGPSFWDKLKGSVKL